MDLPQPDYPVNPDAGNEVILSSAPIHGYKPPVSPTLPLGVLAFGEMRQYWEAGQTVDTPEGYLEKICGTYGVPLVHVEVTGPTELRRQIGGMLALQPAEQEVRTEKLLT